MAMLHTVTLCLMQQQEQRVCHFSFSFNSTVLMTVKAFPFNQDQRMRYCVDGLWCGVENRGEKRDGIKRNRFGGFVPNMPSRGQILFYSLNKNGH